MGDNAYKLELPGDYGVSATFNVADLVSYLAIDEDQDSRTNPFQEGEIDEGSSKPPPVPTVFDGPMTRARAKRLQEDVNHFVSYAMTQEPSAEDPEAPLYTLLSAV